MKIAVAILLACFASAAALGQSVRLIPREQETRVDVEVDGKLFTSYRWDERIRRPVLFPVMAVGGNYLTRGFPIETRDGETINHPHQVGVSLSYGDVNGVDFWNNSPFRTPKELERMGRIALRKIVEMKSGARSAELVTIADWLDPNGKPMLLETTRHIFHASGKLRWIDRQTALTAVGNDVVFGDNKEGFFAIHLNAALQQNDQVPAKITSANGVISERTSVDSLTGKYFSSEGLKGNDVWGTVGRWAAVSGRVGSENLTIAIFDRPRDQSESSRLMVRGYGLLALNPFGQKAFVPAKEAAKFTLKAGRTITFSHRLVIFPEAAGAAEIDKEYQKYR